jgi:hypothetical protein
MRVLVALCLLFVPAAALAGTPGVFQGKVYQEDGRSGWIYVQGRNGMLRRVEVSKARVVYADSVPAGERSTDPSRDLTQGAEVRVTAEQDGAGEWRATHIEILHTFRRRGEKPPKRAGEQPVPPRKAV